MVSAHFMVIWQKIVIFQKFHNGSRNMFVNTIEEMTLPNYVHMSWKFQENYVRMSWKLKWSICFILKDSFLPCAWNITYQSSKCFRREKSIGVLSLQHELRYSQNQSSDLWNLIALELKRQKFETICFSIFES